MYDIHSIPSFSKVTNYHTSVILYNSSSVTIHDMNIIATVITNFTAILIVNTQGDSKIINIKVKINSFNYNCTTFRIQISRFVAYYSGSIFNAESKLTITNFYYNNTFNTACENHFNHIVVLLFLYNICNDAYRSKFLDLLYFRVLIQNCIFNNLKNSSVLCYYGQGKHAYSYRCASIVAIINSTFSNNTGHPRLNMFYIVVNSLTSYPNIIFMNAHIRKSLENAILLRNCIFTRNINMEAIIYIRPPVAYTITTYITVIKSTFYKNINTNFIKVKKESWNIFYVTTYFTLSRVNISCNEHDDGDNLILIANGRVFFKNYVFLNHNKYYENIISLQSSSLVLKNYTEICGNYARYIVKAQINSILFMFGSAAVNISSNVVYKTSKLVSALEKHTVHICPLQINTIATQTNHRFLLLNNTEMISKILSTEITSYFNRNCTFLYNTIFQKTNANVSQKNLIVKFNNTFVNKIIKKRLIPLSVCPCLNNGSYNCYEAQVYSVFPGQILHINLIISPRWYKLPSTIVVANTVDDDCSIVDDYQLSQTHFNNGCNRYSYTIKPNNKFITECKFFIGLTK